MGITGPGWLGSLFAVVMLGTAAYCAGRLAVAWRSRRPTGYAVDLTHMLMGTAMAGMLVPGLGFAPAGLWQATFAATGCWFAAQAVRGLTRGGRGGRRRAGPGLARPGTPRPGRSCTAGLRRDAGHARSPGQQAGARSDAGGRNGGRWAAAGAGHPVRGRPAGVRGAGHRPADRAGPGASRPPRLLRGSAGVPMSLRLAACCDIAVGVTMGYLLILMIA